MAGKRSGGRPTLYKPEYVAQAHKLSLLGLTDKDMADFFQVALSTLSLWKVEHPLFSDAIARGRTAADAEVATSLYERAKGYSHEAVKIFMPAGAKKPVYARYTEHYPPDTPAASIWLWNRRRDLWRRAQPGPDEAADEDGKAIRVEGGLPPPKPPE
jgi:hypothetical protein